LQHAAQQAEAIGETLLHCAAHHGHGRLLEALIGAGARVSIPSMTSGTLPIHAAAAAGHAHICLRLIELGGVGMASAASSKGTPLQLACACVHADAATTLVGAGGADPYACAAGSESPLAMLRRKREEKALSLLAELERLSTQADEQITGEAEVGLAAGPTAEIDEKPFDLWVPKEDDDDDAGDCEQADAYDDEDDEE